MIPSKHFMLIVLALVVTLACGLTPTVPLDYNAAATAVAQTVQAASTPASAPGLVPATVVSGGPSTQTVAQATPTAIPTKVPPTQAGNQPSSKKLTITDIVPYPTNVVYFGNCQAGEITLLNVQATLDPLDQVKSATLWYNLVNFSGRPKSFSTQMWQLRIGDYAGDINLANDAPSHLGDKDGMVEFWIEAIDKGGGTVRSNVYSLSVYYCPGSALGLPPVAIAPTIIYFNATGSVQPGGSVHLEWSVKDAACGVTLDGDFVDTGSWRDYQVPQSQAGMTIVHILRAFGEPCDNPIMVSEQRTISVASANPPIIAERQNLTLIELDPPRWDLDSNEQASGELQLVQAKPNVAGLSKNGGGLAYWNGAGEPNASGCFAAVNNSGVIHVEVYADQYICYITSNGNVGYLTLHSFVLNISSGKYEMKFSFKTWARP